MHPPSQSVNEWPEQHGHLSRESSKAQHMPLLTLCFGKSITRSSSDEQLSSILVSHIHQVTWTVYDLNNMATCSATPRGQATQIAILPITALFSKSRHTLLQLCSVLRNNRVNVTQSSSTLNSVWFEQQCHDRVFHPLSCKFNSTCTSRVEPESPNNVQHLDMSHPSSPSMYSTRPTSPIQWVRHTALATVVGVKSTVSCQYQITPSKLFFCLYPRYSFFFLSGHLALVLALYWVFYLLLIFLSLLVINHSIKTTS